MHLSKLGQCLFQVVQCSAAKCTAPQDHGVQRATLQNLILNSMLHEDALLIYYRPEHSNATSRCNANLAAMPCWSSAMEKAVYQGSKYYLCRPSDYKRHNAVAGVQMHFKLQQARLSRELLLQHRPLKSSPIPDASAKLPPCCAVTPCGTASSAE